MKHWKQMISFLLVCALTVGSMPPGAAVQAKFSRSVVLEDIKATQAFVLDGGYAGIGEVIDYNGDGCVDVFDLALAKRELMQTGVPSLTDFSADIWDVYIGKDTDVTFTLHVTEVAPLAEDAVRVFNEDGTEVAVMHDDGVDGDESAGDGIYTARATLRGDDFSTVDYYAAAEGVRSNSHKIGFYREIKDTEYDSFYALLSRLNTMSFEDAYKEVRHSNEVVSYVADEVQQMILYETAYHITGMWVAPEWRVLEEDEGSVTQDPIEPASLSLSYANSVTAGASDYRTLLEEMGVEDMTFPNGELCTWAQWDEESEEELTYEASSKLKALSKAKGKSTVLNSKTKVAVICPYYKEFGDSVNAVTIGNEVAEAIGSGSADVFKNATFWEEGFSAAHDVTLEKMKQLSEYGVVILSTKSYRIPTDVYWNEATTKAKDVRYGNEYMQIGWEKRKSASSAELARQGIVISSTSWTKDFYAIGKDFFTTFYGYGALKDSFWFLNCPGVMGNETKADSGIGDALISRGAQTVVGYNSSISEASEANGIMNTVFNSLLNGNTISAAVKSYSGTAVVKGKKNYKLIDQTGVLPQTGQMYWMIPKVHAQPGERAIVPVYVYHDVGSCGMLIGLNSELRMHPGVYNAYTNWEAAATTCMDWNDFGNWVMVEKWVPAQRAADGSIVCYASITIPEDCQPGEYTITFEKATVYSADGSTFTPKTYDGAIVVDPASVSTN